MEKKISGDPRQETSYRSIGATTLLAPLPVVMVTSGRQGEDNSNIMTAAWSGIVNTHPPMLSVSIKPSRFSHDLILEQGEFAVNLTDRRLVRAADYCGVRSGRDVNKWKEMGLRERAIPELSCPGIDSSPVTLGCRVHQHLFLGSHTLVIGEIVCVQVREDLFDGDGSLHLERAGLVCYSHGVYQDLNRVLGFFGYSVAREEVLKKRMLAYRPGRAEAGKRKSATQDGQGRKRNHR